MKKKKNTIKRCGLALAKAGMQLLVLCLGLAVW
jgi:hypothetical protein